MTRHAPDGFALERPDYIAESRYREKSGKWDYDDPDQLPDYLRCRTCGKRVWGSNAASRHRKTCAGPVLNTALEDFPPGPCWVDI